MTYFTNSVNEYTKWTGYPIILGIKYILKSHFLSFFLLLFIYFNTYILKINENSIRNHFYNCVYQQGLPFIPLDPAYYNFIKCYIVVQIICYNIILSKWI